MAQALLAILDTSLRSLNTAFGSIHMRNTESLLGVKLDFVDTLIFGCARRFRSAVAEGLNSVLKSPYNLVNLGKKCLSKRYHDVKRFFHRRLIAMQMLMLADKLHHQLVHKSGSL